MKQTLQGAILMLLCLFTSSAAQAQKTTPNAYLITSSSDTLRGQLVKENSSKMLYAIQFGEAGNYKTYQAADINGYGIGDSIRYETKDVLVDGKSYTVFLQLLVDGPAKLYYTQRLHPSYNFFLQKEQGHVVPLNRSYYTGTLSSILSDCEIINVQKHKYTALSLSNLVHAYNNCFTGAQQGKVLHKSNKLTIFWGVRVGASAFHLSYQSEAGSPDHHTFGSTTEPVAGIFANIGAGKQFSVQPELTYTSRRAESTYTHTRNTTVVYNSHIKLDAHYLQLPVLLKYKFGSAKLQPYFNAGPALGLALSKDFTNTVTYQDGSTHVKSMALDNYTLGLVAGAGVQTQLTKRNALSVELRFVRDLANSNHIYKKIHFDSWQLTAGITL
ncbi:porin family protein [Pontibacter sp. H249]|uniref:porin family protein n=1 Tax=Pontibacter sp. H249 TaxID=3133420 RepID=UPI0030BCC5C9